MQDLRNRHFLLLDIAMIGSAVYLSYVLRLEQFNIPQRWRGGMFVLIAVLVLISPLIFQRMGVYARYWRYASVEEMLIFGKAWILAVVLGGAITLAIGMVWGEQLAMPRSMPLILLLVGLFVIAGPRMFVRIASRRNGKGKGKSLARQTEPAKNILIMGAGDAGAMIARELQDNPQLALQAVGFLDDAPAKQGIIIHGLKVLGNRHAIGDIAARQHIDQVIIAMPTAAGKEIRDVVDLCESAGVKTKIVPGVYELLNGKISVNQVRNVEIEDLLRRPPIHTDTAEVYNLLAGKRVLVTGSGGSIGSELARQILRCNPAQLILMGHGENSVFNIYNELNDLHLGTDAQNKVHHRDPYPGPILQPVIADIRSPERIRAVLEEWRPQVIFHAAAHKHVPLMELNPAEAVLNNIMGTYTLLQAAHAVGVEQLVMISTDKAVNPTSIMGATKRVAELLVHQCAQLYNRPYVAVRFGNVLGSRGSVIQTFRRQIATRRPITITHPDMQRYFMTIPEAVQLVLQASVLGQGGEVFVLDMGKPVRIVQLAEDLIRLSGLEVGHDVEIVYTGLRPGEKLFEELFVNGENSTRTAHEQIFIGANAGDFVPRHLDDMLASLTHAAQRNDTQQIKAILKAIIPEYRPLSLAGNAREGCEDADEKNEDDSDTDENNADRENVSNREIYAGAMP